MLRSIPFHPNSFTSFTYPAINQPANADLFPAATVAASVDKRQPKIVRDQRIFDTVNTLDLMRVLLSIYNSLIVPYITYGVCAWGNCALTFQRKIVNLQKRALRLIYFSKSKEHAVPFFHKSNCLPLPSLFFRDCSYLLYDINRQTVPVSILNQFVKTSRQIHNYRTRSVSSESFYVKFSRTDKMHAFFSRIGAQIWNSIPYSIKVLKRSSFRKKIKELLLNFLRSEDEYVEVSCLIKLFNTLG